jgi:hypothetical protein
VTEPTKIGVKLKAENCDIAYPPIFQVDARWRRGGGARRGAPAASKADEQQMQPMRRFRWFSAGPSFAPDEPLLPPSRPNVSPSPPLPLLLSPCQSGGRFDLKLSAASDDSNLAQEGVITVAMGTRYASYCANIARCGGGPGDQGEGLSCMGGGSRGWLRQLLRQHRAVGRGPLLRVGKGGEGPWGGRLGACRAGARLSAFPA